MSWTCFSILLCSIDLFMGQLMMREQLMILIFYCKNVWPIFPVLYDLDWSQFRLCSPVYQLTTALPFVAPSLISHSDLSIKSSFLIALQFNLTSLHTVLSHLDQPIAMKANKHLHFDGWTSRIPWQGFCSDGVHYTYLFIRVLLQSVSQYTAM